MTSQTFEGRLSRVLGSYADDALRPIDAMTIATSAATARRPSRLVVAWDSLRPAMRVAIVLALAGAVLFGAFVIGSRLLKEPPLAGGGTLFVWTPNSNETGVVRLLDSDGRVMASIALPAVRHCPRLLPDGRAVAYWRGDNTGALVSQPLDGSAPTVFEDTTFRDPGTEVWSPNGDRVAVRFGTLRVFNLADGTEQTPAVGEHIVAAAWAPTGGLTVAQQMGSEVVIVAVDLVGSTSRELFRFTWNSGADGYPFFSWSPDGRYVLYSIHQYRDVLAFDTQAGTSTTLLSDGPGLFDAAGAWSSDGRIALMDADGQIVVSRPDGTRINTIQLSSVSQAQLHPPRWSPDGTSLALMGEKVVVTVHADGTHEQAHLQDDVNSFAWSPDSAWLAVESRSTARETAGQSRISLFATDTTDRRTLGIFSPDDAGPRGNWACLAWSDDSS